MRLIATLLIGLALAGCASNRAAYQPYQPRMMTYEQISNYKVDDVDCPRLESIMGDIKQQLAMRGLTNVNPEDMSEENRKFNEKSKVIIWALVIGCNNPDRYKK